MKNLKNLRLKAGYSQTQLAQFLHVGAGTAARWELCHSLPTLGQFLKLCLLLGCRPAQLVDCCDDANIDIPVFSVKNRDVKAHSFSADNLLHSCDFGVVVPYDIDGRFATGDVCFFEFSTTGEKDCLVLCLDNDYNEYLQIFKEYDENMQIIAICRFLYTKI